MVISNIRGDVLVTSPAFLAKASVLLVKPSPKLKENILLVSHP
jgi:hypothetical protein